MPSDWQGGRALTEPELVLTIDRINDLWPRMNMTVAMTECWRVMLRPCQYEAAYKALTDHWNEDGDKWNPDQKKVRILIREHTHEYRSESEQATAERFYAMTPLDQARAQREWFDSQAAKETDYIARSKYQQLATVAADQVARLYRIESERPPIKMATVSEVEKVARCRLTRA